VRQALLGAKHARITLEAGFVTVRNVAALGFSDIALRDAIDDGDLPGPRILASGPAIGITGGHCDNNLLPFHFESRIPDGIADAREWTGRRCLCVRRRARSPRNHAPPEVTEFLERCPSLLLRPLSPAPTVHCPRLGAHRNLLTRA
jgi:hypothetical protein